MITDCHQDGQLLASWLLSLPTLFLFLMLVVELALQLEQTWILPNRNQARRMYSILSLKYCGPHVGPSLRCRSRTGRLHSGRATQGNGGTSGRSASLISRWRRQLLHSNRANGAAGRRSRHCDDGRERHRYIVPRAALH